MSEVGPRTKALLDRARWLVLWAVVLGLAGLAAYLQVERNRRTYFVEAVEGKLVVSKGIPFLWGSSPYVPEDAADTEAYAPIDLPAGAQPPDAQRFGDREELDRWLFDRLADWAEARVKTEEPQKLEEGVRLVGRATRLQGISAAQAGRLRALRADVAYHDAREKLERAGALLAQARDQLREAADGAGPRSRDAAALVDAVKASADVVAQTVRAAKLHGTTPVPPPAAPAAPPPTPAPPAEAPAPAEPAAKTP